MKLIFIGLFFYSCSLFSQNKIYDVRLQALDSSSIDMANYKGKKILVAVTSPQHLQDQKMRFLDSLKRSYPNLSIIAVPAEDFGGERNAEILTSIKNNTSKLFIVAGASQVRKSAKEKQHPLMIWLTDVSKNGHFDADVFTEDRLYVISESGVLYAVLGKKVSPKVLDEILNQRDVKDFVSQ